MTMTSIAERPSGETVADHPVNRMLSVNGQLNVTALRSLILGIRLRGRLGASERELLDSLAPEGWITFLASRHGWVHPLETELFDLDKLQCTSHQGGGAIFSQQCRAGLTGDRCWRILSAVVADDQQAPLILGWCGPEYEAVADLMLPAFSNLVRQTRTAWIELNDLVGELSTGLARGEPMLVINRGSGRVLAANEAAAYAFDSTRHNLTDMEFTALSRSGRSEWSRGRMSMQNLNAAGLDLTVMTLETPVGATGQDPFGADFFTYRVRHKISHLMMAATLLEAMAAKNEDWSESALVESIVGEVELLDEYMQKANILIDYDHLEVTRASLITTLEESTDLVERALSCEGTISIVDEAGNPSFHVPRSAAVTLFETILLSHLINRPPMARTAITVSRPPESTGLRIQFETQAKAIGGTIAADRGWLDYADRLAVRMGIGNMHSSDGKTVLRTCLTLGTEQRMGIDFE